MSKKRKREGTEVNVGLVSIYDSLAHENETVRLKAAQQLLTKTFSDASTEEEVRTVLKRLFRGLCSSRKAARLGFVVALTECLSQTQTSDVKPNFPPSQIVDIFETATEAEGGSRGQEERDYFFGRVFGAGAIIQSGVLFAGEDRTQWKRLLVLLCAVALKKPWLRQECGWTLCQFCAGSSDDASTLLPFVEDIITILNEHKLIRTPEGVAIWLTAKQAFPHATLSKHVWKFSHPLAPKDVQNLAEVMKNARTREPEAEHGAQGSTSWSASLHFAWTVVLKNLYGQQSQKGTNGTSKAKAGQEIVSFADFWRIVVDEGLFTAGSSNERKLWGVQLFAQAVLTAPPTMLSNTLCPNTLHTLMSAFGAEAGYLHKSAQSSLQQLEKRVRHESWSSTGKAPGDCICAILEATQYCDFDSATKSKVMVTLLEKGDQKHTLIMLRKLQSTIQEQTGTASIRKSKYLISLEYKLVASCIRHLSQEDVETAQALISEILRHGLQRVDNEPNGLRQHIRDRNSAAFEQLIRAGPKGQILFSQILNIQDLLEKVSDPAMQQILEAAAKRLRKLEKASKKHSQLLEPSPTKSSTSSLLDGYKLLYSLVAFDIYNGEQESIEIMQDLLESESPDAKSQNSSTDPLVEILLSFSSRPSRFLRTLTPIIFESIASGITSSGIESLTRVLATKENAKGQQDMFEAADQMDLDGASGSDNDESAEELDSDVEVVDVDQSSEADSDSDSDSDSESESDISSGSDTDSEEEASEEDDELAAFDAALAAALGTSKPNGAEKEDNETSDSDSDMDDDQMLALDAKLSEVFRARNESNKPNKKKEAKDAKDTIVNFKNRVLDLLEVYIKHQHLNPHAIELVLPLLRSIRTTQTKQIAEHSSKVLKDLCARCKGQNVPMLQLNSKDRSEEAAVKILQEVHDEACLEASNLHSTAASQASTLLVKVLIKSGVSIATVTAVYGATMTRMLTDAKCKVQPGFFTDWNNWCVSARAWTTKL